MVRLAGRSRKAQFSVPNLPPPKPPKPPVRPLRLTTRAEWEAAPPPEDNPGERLELPIEHIRYLHTGTEQCDHPDECLPIVRRLQAASMEQGNPDIMYNFLVGGDLVMYEGRGFDYRCSKKDFWVDSPGESISIAYIGNFKGEQIPYEMRHVSEHFIKWGQFYRLVSDAVETTPSTLEPYDKEELEARLEDVPDSSHLSTEEIEEIYNNPVGWYKANKTLGIKEGDGDEEGQEDDGGGGDDLDDDVGEGDDLDDDDGVGDDDDLDDLDVEASAGGFGGWKEDDQVEEDGDGVGEEENVGVDGGGNEEEND